MPSLCPRYTFYLKNRVFGECGANIMSQILEKLKVNIVYKLNAENNDYEAIVERERSDIENYNSKIRKNLTISERYFYYNKSSAHSKNKCVVKCVIFTHCTRCQVCNIERSVYLLNTLQMPKKLLS